jgi:hypothetical protein
MGFLPGLTGDDLNIWGGMAQQKSTLVLVQPLQFRFLELRIVKQRESDIQVVKRRRHKKNYTSESYYKKSRRDPAFLYDRNPLQSILLTLRISDAQNFLTVLAVQPDLLAKLKGAGQEALPFAGIIHQPRFEFLDKPVSF